MNSKIKHFESASRVEELSPINSLKRIGFTENMVLCDIGAGTGVFTFPAAEISHKDIYSLEKSDEMIEILNKRIIERKIKNIKVKKVETDVLPVEDNTCDIISNRSIFNEGIISIVLSMGFYK